MGSVHGDRGRAASRKPGIAELDIQCQEGVDVR